MPSVSQLNNKKGYFYNHDSLMNSSKNQLQSQTWLDLLLYSHVYILKINKQTNFIYVHSMNLIFNKVLDSLPINMLYCLYFHLKRPSISFFQLTKIWVEGWLLFSLLHISNLCHVLPVQFCKIYLELDHSRHHFPSDDSNRLFTAFQLPSAHVFAVLV